MAAEVASGLHHHIVGGDLINWKLRARAFSLYWCSISLLVVHADTTVHSQWVSDTATCCKHALFLDRENVKQWWKSFRESGKQWWKGKRYRELWVKLHKYCQVSKKTPAHVKSMGDWLFTQILPWIFFHYKVILREINTSAWNSEHLLYMCDRAIEWWGDKDMSITSSVAWLH